MAQAISLPRHAERVIVIGTSGAGKTSLARALALRLGCPAVELDELFWGPAWTPKPAEEFRRLADAATLGRRWVVDGNYAPVRDLLWPRATTIVWLNYATPVLFGRVLVRTMGRMMTGATLWHGNRESFRRSFLSKESILLWVLTTYRKRRVEFAALRASGAYPHVEWIELRRPRQATQMLQRITAAPAAEMVQ